MKNQRFNKKINIYVKKDSNYSMRLILFLKNEEVLINFWDEGALSSRLE
ncbi:hypothetical protein BN1423_750008 [Carnobacterium maltaromaticum]|nr:hypothetical protein BN1423_750008 [Carnobacterium maltaromaticum]